MKLVTLLVAAFALLSLQFIDAEARDLTAAYSAAELKKEGKRLETAVRNIYEIGVKPTLTDDELNKLSDVAFFFTEPRAGDYFLNFYAASAQGQSAVVLPILSLKVLEDVATAYAWLYANDYSLSTIDLYFAMLQHRDKEDFPGGEYPAPLDALGIPANAWDDPKVDKLSLALRNEAIAFILVHELGHILYEHRGYDEITREQAREDETQSDRFALDVLARSATPPLGAVMFFQAQFYSLPMRGEYETPAKWQDFLKERATHPLTEDRLKALVSYISGELAERRGAEKAVWQSIGMGLNFIISVLQDTDLQKCVIRVAEKAPFDVVRPRPQTAQNAMMRLCADLE